MKLKLAIFLLLVFPTISLGQSNPKDFHVWFAQVKIIAFKEYNIRIPKYDESWSEWLRIVCFQEGKTPKEAMSIVAPYVRQRGGRWYIKDWD